MEKRKKILYLGNQLSQHGKNETGVEFLGRKLKAWGYSVKQVSSYQNILIRFLHMLWSVLQVTSSNSVILIDTYSTRNFWYAYVSALLARLRGIPYICILRGGNLQSRLNENPKSSKTLFSKAEHLISLSDYLKEVFLQENYKTELIPNGFDITDYDFKERKQVAPKILWVRSFAEIYHPLLAIKVLEQLLKTYPKAELCMIGPQDAAAFNACKTYAEKHQLPVEFTGKLSKEEWRNRSKEFDIFLNTTNFDNTPMSLMEAAALGLPIVSTNVGGIPYLLKHNIHALLVEPNQVKFMLEAIKEAVENPTETYKRSLAARKLVENFDWKIIKEQWIRVLSS
ncbi:glycosyltransferase family 4 protein [Mesonia ostreae]|uniref:Glycosyltransferase family 4 protein n=1 Tax=Mesonia ostreae TaxID=861110 RepID=A0ABU2KLY1_9FLAO|nr:glycosyltransferase family 4 protein [Mesonia ostreae]MDT0295725.1 glycosyltransferase family 4 protein [Mesonia ostreae]